MPPWPFSSGTSPDTTSATTRLPSSLERHAQTSPVQSPTTLDPYAPPASNAAHRSSVNTPPSSPKRVHGRSLSGTLPALFGGAKKKPPSHDESLSKSSPTTQDGNRGFMLPRKSAPRPPVEDGEVEVGNCATCGIKVKWPKGMSQYRCNTCLMVNDLKPHQRQPARMEESTINRNGSGREVEPYINSPLSNIDQMKAVISSCVDTYLKLRRPESTEPNTCRTTTPPSHSPIRNSLQPNEVYASPKKTGPLRNPRSPTRQENPVEEATSPKDSRRYGYIQPQNLHPQEAAVVRDIRYNNVNNMRRELGQPFTRSASYPERPGMQDKEQPQRPMRKPLPSPLNLPIRGRIDSIRGPPTRLPNPSDEGALEHGSKSPSPSRQEEVVASRHIFKALEDNILHTFGNQQCLNKSFLISRPIPRGHVRSADSIHRSRSDVGRMKGIDSSMSELDAKTVLLGDVAENGLWWTGRDARLDNSMDPDRCDKTEMSPENLVHSRSPCINFAELSRWYAVVLGAGENWRKDANLQDDRLTDDEVREIDDAFLEARVHVQRTLLKVSEAVLKRPGRPLKNPNDIRFLLILLANPLLDPQRPGVLPREPRKVSENPKAPIFLDRSLDLGKEGRKLDNSSLVWDHSHAFGVLKRILGLLSNLSNECHRHLTLWFARYNENQLRQLVEMIQSFITYRLGRQQAQKQGNGNAEIGLIPGLAGTSAETSAQLHAALGLPSQSRNAMESSKYPPYSSDWQIKAAARVMALLFSANKVFQGERLIERRMKILRSQPVATSDFYNTIVDLSDLIADFDTWESGQGRFAFCQYPFLLSVGAKIRIMEHDARRQMEIKAREAFFNSILRNKTLEQHLTLKVRRECLVEDSLKGISEVVGAGQQDIKKGLKVQFIDEEGVDAGGLRKEWFLLLVREIFEPQHGLFVYDEDSHLCYFNPHSFETSDQYFLVGALLGLAIYNSTILDVALPPFAFKKLLASGSVSHNQKTPFNRMPISYTLDDLAEYRPALANGLRQVLEYDGDVETNLSLDFVVEIDRYGSKLQVPLCADGDKKPVTNANRQEFVDLYVRYLLDTQVSRQFEPFKRGFFTVCGGNALSLFQAEEIELLIRGSDEPLDVPSLKAVAVYDNWGRGERKVENPAEQIHLIQWFWEIFEQAEPKDQRKLLGFITGSDRIPAMGAASLVIKIAFAGKNYNRFPIARTCFNLLLLYKYRTKEELSTKLWRAVTESEGFGLK